MRVVENYAGGKPSPLGDLPEEKFQMRRIMVSFLFAVCTRTLLWARGQAQLAHSIGTETGSHQWLSQGLPGRG
jgi:hypothetical protein